VELDLAEVEVVKAVSEDEQPASRHVAATTKNTHENVARSIRSLGRT
jgi:phage regulator Rha-like protein